MKALPTLAVVAALSFSDRACVSQDAQNKGLDQPAPSFESARWTTKQTVQSFERGKVYVIQFAQDDVRSLHPAPLGNWFEPLRTRVVPVFVFYGSRKLDFDKLSQAVEKAALPDLRIAFDADRKIYESWLEANGKSAPISAVVDKKGRLVWFGGTLWLNFVVDAALAGKDIGKARKELDTIQKATFSTDGIVADDPKAAVKAAHELYKRYPPAGALVLPMVFDALMKKGELALADSLAPAAFEAALIDGHDNTLNDLAWSYVDPSIDRKDRKLDLAMKAAQAAVKASGERDGAFLDTLARVYFWKKDYANAIAIQKKAIEVTEYDDDREPLEATLAAYEAAARK